MDSQSSYFDQNGSPILRVSYCVFLDVLGFSKMIKENQESDSLDQFFKEFYGVINSAIHALNSTGEMNYWQAKPFTDNTVLGCPVGKTESDIEFNSLIAAVSDYQLRMALSGFFVRGAIASGRLFMDENLVYGSPIVDAHQLESTVAKVPRVILSKPVQESMCSFAMQYDQLQDSPQYRDFLTDWDGISYINYLRQLITEEEGSPKIDGKKLRTHRTQIEKRLGEFSPSIDIWSKYHWLANYHNNFCQQHSELLGCKLQEVLINPDLVKISPGCITPRDPNQRTS